MAWNNVPGSNGLWQYDDAPPEPTVGTREHDLWTLQTNGIRTYTVSGAVTGISIVESGTGYLSDGTNVFALYDLSGTGSGLTIDYTTDGNQVLTVSINKAGYNYEVGDILKVNSGNGDSTIQVDSIGLNNKMEIYTRVRRVIDGTPEDLTGYGNEFYQRGELNKTYYDNLI